MRSSMYVFLDVSIVLIVLFMLQKYKWSTLDPLRQIVHKLFFIYCLSVIVLTIFPVSSMIPQLFYKPLFSMNMNAFSDVFKGYGNYYQQIALNIILFIPFGLLLPMIKKLKGYQVILLGFSFSLMIELIQPLLLFSRISDVTDIITNTTGALLGYLLYLSFKPLLRKIAKAQGE